MLPKFQTKLREFELRKKKNPRHCLSPPQAPHRNLSFFQFPSPRFQRPRRLLKRLGFFALSEDSSQCRWFRLSLRCFLPHWRRRAVSARGNPRNSEVSVVTAFSRVLFRAESGDRRRISLRFYELCGVVELWGR